MTKRKGKQSGAAAAAAAKAAALGLPTLGGIDPRSASGRKARTVAVGYERDASQAGYKTRARQMGLISGNEDMSHPVTASRVAAALSIAKSQLWEGEAGQAIFVAFDDAEERERMANLWRAFFAARTLWKKRSLGIHATATSFAAMPIAKVIEVTEHYEPDLRTSDERALDADALWLPWRKRMTRISPFAADTLVFAVEGGIVFQEQGVLNAYGRQFVNALRELAAAKRDLPDKG